MIDDKFKMLLYEIARFCFRDVADNDYLSARILFRYGFIQQAYWNSEQAVEKYLKSILLFNEMSAKSVGHDLELALSKVESIPHIKIELPDDVRSSIVELNNEGKNRYFEYPYHFSDLTFYKLDKLIWHIRRYCITKGGLFDIGSKKINLQEYELIIAQQDKYKKKPSKYSFASKGIIEKILNDKKSLQRKQLIWKNQYFGRRQKKVIKNVNVTLSFGKPPHFSDSCNVDELSKYVQLNDDVIKYLKNKA